MTRLLAPLWLSAIAGCTLASPDFIGKQCQRAADCPQPLSCVNARPGGAPTCELLSTPGEIEAGEPAYYCSDVKPILDAYCVSCHGVPPAGGAPTFLRLDVYEDTTVGGMTVQGAQSQAERIKVRTVDQRTMPPVGFPAPTVEENALLTAWYRAGAPECAADAGQ